MFKKTNLTIGILALIPFVAVFMPSSYLGYFIATLLLSHLWSLEFLRNKRLNFNLIRPYIVFIVFCIFFTLIAEDMTIAVKRLERYISLLLIPLVVFTMNWNKKRIHFFIRCYISILIGISIFSIGRIIWFVFTFSDWISKMNAINNNYTYVQFKYPHLMWDVHPSYWSYLIILGIVLLMNNTFFGSFLRKKWAWGLTFFFVLNLFFLASRVPILIFCIIFFLIVAKENFKRKFILVLGLLGIMGAIVYSLPFLRYKLINIPADDRFYLWGIAYQAIRDNSFIFGEGFGNSSYYLESALNGTKDPRTNYNGFELHNQYLMILLETGVLGLASLMYLFVGTTIRVKEWKLNASAPQISLLIVCLFACIIEPFFIVVKGIVIFAVFSSTFMIFSLRKT